MVRATITICLLPVIGETSPVPPTTMPKHRETRRRALDRINFTTAKAIPGREAEAMWMVRTRNHLLVRTRNHLFLGWTRLLTTMIGLSSRTILETERSIILVTETSLFRLSGMTWSKTPGTISGL